MRWNGLIVGAVLLTAAAAAPAQGRFRPPVAEAGLNLPGTSVNEYQPTLTGDQLEVWFSSDRPGGRGLYDIYTARRPDLATPWSAPVNVTELNTASQEQYLSVTNDGLEIYISTNRPGSVGLHDLWVSTRPDRMSPWTPPVRVAELSSTSQDEDPALTGDGLEIFLTSSRPPSLGRGDLWRATRPDRNSPWSTPVPVAELNTSDYDHSPAPSDDGLRLFFAATSRGGAGSSDYFYTTRPDRNSPFGAPVNVAEINTPYWDFNGDLSSDEFSFYYSSYPNGAPGADLFRADGILPRTVSSGPAHAGLPWSVWCRRDPGSDVGGLALSASANTAGTPIPGIQGRLHLDFPFVFVAIGVCDRNGRVPFDIAAVPGAVGVQVFFQSFAQDPGGVLYLGNLLAVTIVP